MFNSFISKITGIFNVSESNLPSTPKPAVKETVTTVEEKNRVALPTKPSVQAPVSKPISTVPVAPIDKELLVALNNAKSLETEARKKEFEITQQLNVLAEREKYLIQKEKNLDSLQVEIKNKQTHIDEIYKKQLDKLEQISQLPIEKAKLLVMNIADKKIADWTAKKVQESRQDIKQKEEDIIKEIIVDSLHHGVTDYVAEYTVSIMSLPDDKIKGKIIGREGRNIHAFEKATGVELELDETNDIRISSFDSTRREIAKIALEKLIKDGRIQPIKITQVVEQTKLEMDKILLNEGKKICQECGVYNLPIELMKEIGKYKYRFSYGQNLAKHSIEVTKIGVAIANELNANVSIVRLACLLHDIGKVSDEDGNHVDLGVSILKQNKLPELVINCVAESHEDLPISSPESAISYLADAISGSRPGSRYAGHEEYLSRIKNIEEVARNFPGVIDVAAYQAGREVMVIVNPEEVTDNEAISLSQNIAEGLEEEANWAGKIKVTVIRETKNSYTINKINKNAEKTN